MPARKPRAAKAAPAPETLTETRERLAATYTEAGVPALPVPPVPDSIVATALPERTDKQVGVRIEFVDAKGEPTEMDPSGPVSKSEAKRRAVVLPQSVTEEIIERDGIVRNSIPEGYTPGPWTVVPADGPAVVVPVNPSHSLPSDAWTGRDPNATEPTLVNTETGQVVGRLSDRMAAGLVVGKGALGPEIEACIRQMEDYPGTDGEGNLLDPSIAERLRVHENFPLTEVVARRIYRGRTETGTFEPDPATLAYIEAHRLATALEGYRAVTSGKVRFAEWHGHFLQSVTGPPIGAVFPTANNEHGARFQGTERAGDCPEAEARAWVEEQATAAGWKVVEAEGKGKRRG